MARRITISRGRLSAAVAPDNGGLLASLRIGETEVLRMDEELLDAAPVLSGGVPILFPFPSKTENDTYTANGTEYGMPFHGLVKNVAFGVREVKPDSVSLYLEPSPTWLEKHYPFPFLLDITYRLTDDGICIETAVTNTGTQPLPHALGLHPYFRVTDRKAARLTHFCTVNYDYVNHIDAAPAPKFPDLTQVWDHVFHSPTEHRFIVESPADGYRAECRYDEVFSALVLCTTEPGAVCVEPWCALPNAANSGRFAQSVAPGETKTYRMQLIPTELK